LTWENDIITKTESKLKTLFFFYIFKVCQWLATGRWFSSGTPVSSTNKTDLHDITEILLKVALNTINQTKPSLIYFYNMYILHCTSGNNKNMWISYLLIKGNIIYSYIIHDVLNGHFHNLTLFCVRIDISRLQRMIRRDLCI